MKQRDVKQDALIVLRRLLNHSGMRNKKIFAIGFNKCGTTSLHALFKRLARPSYHGVDWRGCDNLRLLRAYDCFSDGIPADLAKLDRLFPGARFILQLRDLEGWVYSRLAHIEREKKQGIHQAHAEWDDTEEAVKAWMVKRNAYHLFVLDYFARRPQDLLVVNFIRDSGAATKVCNFLGYHGRFDRPNENVNPSKQPPEHHVELLRRASAALGVPWHELQYDIYCPSLEQDPAARRFAADSSLLVSEQAASA